MFKETIKPTIDKALELRPDLDNISVSIYINVEKIHKNIKRFIRKIKNRCWFRTCYSKDCSEFICISEKNKKNRINHKRRTWIFEKQKA